MSKIIVPIKGMHCRSCEILIEQNLKDIPGVRKVDVNYKTGKAEVFFEKREGADMKEFVGEISQTIKQTVKDTGYEIGYKDTLEWVSQDQSDYINLLYGVVILVVLYFAAKSFGLFNIDVNTDSASLYVVLMVGLVAGVSTCMALVGGLVLGISARHAEAHPEISTKQKFTPHLYFNLGRVLGFGFFGGVLALLGSVVQPSAGTLGLMTIIIGGVMIFLGLKLVEIFPFLKDKSISLPKSISNFLGIHKEQKEYSHKSSFITGALTFFLPCGFTQAMQLFAVTSGSFVQGVLIMSLFALGTAPGLLGIGGLASIFKGRKAKVFFAATGVAVIILGLVNITNGSQLAFQGKPQAANAGVATSSGVQEVQMTQSGSGYSPNTLTVEKGKKVRWVITSTNPFSCASSIVMPKYGISKSLVKGENIIEFTPTDVGEIPFSCSMGMYRGKFIVTESGATGAAQNSQTTASANVPATTSGGSCGGGGGGGCGGGCGGGAAKPIDTAATAPAANNNEQIINATYTLAKDISPNRFEVKKGQPVRFEIDVKDNGQGCMSSLKVPGLYNTAQYLQGGTKMVLAFTPQTAGNYNITCSMGVPRGVITVTD